jgi:hypothetical protein
MVSFFYLKKITTTKSYENAAVNYLTNLFFYNGNKTQRLVIRYWMQNIIMELTF